MATDHRTTERLQQLRERIERWRRTRRKHGPMPSDLWDEAAALARSLGVCPVSRALRVGYESLQQRAAAARPSPAPSRGEFVELSGAQFVGMAAPGSSASIEVIAADGARLAIRLPADLALDVAALVASFRRQA
jgi:hypothetical protein